MGAQLQRLATGGDIQPTLEVTSLIGTTPIVADGKGAKLQQHVTFW